MPAPTASDLQARFPAFATVASGTVDYWLADAALIVTTDWFETDYGPAIMELAAHNMALLGLEPQIAGAVALPAGVTRFRSGSVDISLSEAAVSAASAGGYEATPYGRMFSARLRRNRGGAFLATL